MQILCLSVILFYFCMENREYEANEYGKEN